MPSPQTTARGQARSASVFDHSILKQTEVQIEIIVQYISKVIDRAYGRIESVIPAFWKVKCGQNLISRIAFAVVAVISSYNNDRFIIIAAQDSINHIQHQRIYVDKLPNECVRDAGVMTIIKCYFWLIWSNIVPMLIECCWPMGLVYVCKNKLCLILSTALVRNSNILSVSADNNTHTECLHQQQIVASYWFDARPLFA